MEEIINDIRFMEDYLQMEDENDAHISSESMQQHLNMYINAFFAYVGRQIYSQLTRSGQE